MVTENITLTTTALIDGKVPAAEMPLWFKLGIQLVSLVLIYLYGPNLLKSWHYDPANSPLDFVQDWCSARNWNTGEAIYASLEKTLPRYVYQLKADEHLHIKHNAHPPASVLMILPLGKLAYTEALAIWVTLILIALVSGLILIARQLQIDISGWFILPTAALMLISPPVFLDFVQGNWSVMLFFCVTLTWALARQGHDLRAGMMLGVTASLKLYPAFLILFFVAQRRWQGVGGFVLSFLLMNTLAGLVLGWDCFVDYQNATKEVLSNFQAAWNNGSLPGMAAKLFAPHVISKEQLVPLIDAPWLVTFCTAAAFLVFIIFTGRLAYRANTRAEQDDVFALIITAANLLSPITWMGGILLLGMPFVLLWQRSRDWPRLRFLFAIVFWFGFSSQLWVLEYVTQRTQTNPVFQPWETLTYLNTLCYTFLGFFWLQWSVMKCSTVSLVFDGS